MLTLVPVGSFEEKARKLLGASGFDDLLEFLARRTRAGKVLQRTGESRKVRFGQPGKGKRSSTLLLGDWRWMKNFFESSIRI